MSSAAKGLTIALILAAGALSQIGCRACCAPYDYSGPVVGCECDACGSGQCGSGQGRSGSAVTHFADAADATDKASMVASEADGTILR